MFTSGKITRVSSLFKPIYLLIGAAVLLSQCASPAKIIKFEKKPDETFANDRLKNLFAANPSPNIVVRVLESVDRSTSRGTMDEQNAPDSNWVIYNAIEKGLVREGFSVKDRSVFNELVEKSGTQDYANLKGLTNTDLILEVQHIDRAIPYSSNKMTIVNKWNEADQTTDKIYSIFGASLEFRIVEVANNEIGGTFKYYYQPYPYGCNVKNFHPPAKGTSGPVQLDNRILNNDLENFVTLCTSSMVKSLRDKH